MSWMAVAAIGGSVISGVIGSSAASKAAAAQAAAGKAAAATTLEATQETNQLNWDIYEQNLSELSPTMQIQQEAETALAGGLGLGTPTVGTSQLGLNSGTPTGVGANSFQATTGGTPVYAPPNTGGVPSGGAPATATTGGAPGMATTQNVPTSTVAAQNKGSVLPPPQMSTTAAVPPGSSTLTGTSTPAATYGTMPGGPSSTPGSSLTGVNPGGVVTPGATQGQLNTAGASQAPGSLLANFNNADLNTQLSPSYGFILGQGQNATQNYNAAHGITGGNATNAETAYTENTASTFYQQAFSNYLTQQQQNISALTNLAGGQSATGAAVGAGTSAGSTIGQTTMSGVGASTGYQTGAAAASAAGTVGVANALTGAIGTGTSGVLTSQLINNMNPNSTSNPNNPYYGAPSGWTPTPTNNGSSPLTYQQEVNQGF